MQERDYDLIVISDLHLSEGWDEDTGRIDPNEDFFFDLSFRRFLEHLKTQEKGCKLIINGDFVDFLQVTSVPEHIDGETITVSEGGKNGKPGLGLGTSPAKTVWKLKKIISGHRIFFRGLAEFLAHKPQNEIYILPGNHDIEFVIDDVQKAFWEKLVEYAPNGHSLKKTDVLKEKVQFLPWFYYDKNYSVYVEHGCQYDALNSFDFFLYPYRPHDRPSGAMIDLPAGSFFVRYLFNKVELDYPFADNMKPVSRFMRWFLWRLYRWSNLSQLVKYIRFFYKTLAKAGPIKQEWKEQITAKQDGIIRSIAKEYSLDPNKLFSIKNMWVPSAIHNNPWYKLLLKFFTHSLPKSYLREKASGIHNALGTRYIIFGHTHEADLYKFPRDADEKNQNQYMNSGTWTKGFASNYEEMLLKEENEFAYVHIKDIGGEIKMELLRWKEALGEGERIRLFEEQYKENDKSF